ncbi:hypothetical protein HFZ78_17055 [Priestia megaterium]|uniref:Uncharacterized protein n=1 Tax=Priestia megaterium TaxID=1404 RepID=A0A6H1P441_PRIMG|nr:hypothetical protein [Priestia megaterium]QIZ08225.1 hypothetical protein HFZ78_17055 [Priestia megaterium]
MANGCFPSIKISKDLQLTGARVEDPAAILGGFSYLTNEVGLLSNKGLNFVYY